MAIITISRQVGAFGDEVAESVARLLNYKFITRTEIEQRIVEMGFPESKMPKFDERKAGFFASLTKDRDEYFNYMQLAVLEAAEQKNVVIIGRGANTLLQNVPNNISIRLIADEKTRIKRLMEKKSWDEKKAVQRIRESDANREGFLSSFYNSDIHDISAYHAVFNTALISRENAAKMIADLVETLVTVKQEEDGNRMIAELLKGQSVVNKLYFEHKLNIDFMHVSIEDKTVLLHGVSDSPAIVEQALQIIRKEMPEYEAKSAVSIVHDFKTFQ